MKTLFRKIVGSYVLSLAFALWGGVCIIVGATWAYLVLIGMLNAQGVL